MQFSLLFLVGICCFSMCIFMTFSQYLPAGDNLTAANIESSFDNQDVGKSNFNVQSTSTTTNKPLSYVNNNKPNNIQSVANLNNNVISIENQHQSNSIKNNVMDNHISNQDNFVASNPVKNLLNNHPVKNPINNQNNMISLETINNSNKNDNNYPVNSNSAKHEIVVIENNIRNEDQESMAEDNNGIHIGTLETNALKEIEVQQRNKIVGPIEQYIAQGKKLPILMLTCNRDQYLKETLENLFQVRGITKDQIIVSQDGQMQAVENVVKSFHLHLTQNVGGTNLRKGRPMDGAQRIASHYKYSLSYAFNKFPDAPAIIIIEDDLLFSPDFIEYFERNAPILEQDPTTFVLSSWNDNGFRGMINDPYRMLRTTFFPGLGWLLPRKLFKEELERIWPTEHWDHWLRDEKRHKNRDCIYPEQPRDFHNGKKGTFMNDDTHKKFFARIDYNLDSTLSWTQPNYEIKPPYQRAMKKAFDASIEDQFSRSIQLKSLDEIMHYQGKELVMWIKANPSTDRGNDFQAIGNYFKIWHEEVRATYRGVHRFIDDVSGNKIMIVNANSEFGKKFASSQGKIFSTNDFRGKHRSAPIKNIKKSEIDILKSGTSGTSCEEVCRSQGSKCMEDYFDMINTCDTMQKAFPCQQCEESFGSEQPAYVIETAPQDKLPGHCLVTSDPSKSTCSSTHLLTKRLCPCAKLKK